MTWHVWQAFESDRRYDNRALWRALAEACRTEDGRIDVTEFERWLDVFVWYRRGET